MKSIVKKLLTMALLVSVACGTASLAIPHAASAKSMSKVTKVITLTRDEVHHS